ncbi:Fis family transcriptional regulator [Massilia sp. Root418]|uniref:sigma-54 dependent transcriptional regulator n=1 Tax=Massilia sp. Root418 TaxID=1736532 RepID=UPI0006F6BF5F|nr:sigma-54 dependent transcriptional regulator [Massilia sp. Root418]KQX01968.1 Fis family transcriptional regulator [Massilia sp. Root418]
MPTKNLLCLTLGAAGASRTATQLDALLPGWELCKAASLRDASRVLRSRALSVGLLLLECEEAAGAAAALAGLDAFLRQHHQLHWIAVCHRALLQSEAWRVLVREHCSDFHTWPLDGGRLLHTVGHALGLAALRAAPVPAPAPALPQQSPLIGQTPALRRLHGQIARVAPADAAVLIWGESGTGKELVAQAIHARSGAAGGPFVAVNCAAIAPSLAQSELFGYVRGAFTGAAQDRRGLLESADGGTIFLDEIGDLPLELQANLLRFLQEKCVLRVGGTRSVPVNARVIAASHVDLEAAVARGAFRQDLYYRLNVLSLQVPALRERKDDLPLLADHFFVQFAAERAPRIRGYSGAALAAMRRYHWPGNVRELINRVRRALIMAEGRLIQPADLGLDGEAAPDGCEPLGGVRVRAERQAIEVGLGLGKSMTQVAEDLGVSRMTLYRLMAKHGISHPARARGAGS